jgi:hypothetical protein
MIDSQKVAQQSKVAGSASRFLWQHKAWWLPPLVVLLLLLGIIYFLGHMSSANPEMYPTTHHKHASHFRLC